MKSIPIKLNHQRLHLCLLAAALAFAVVNARADANVLANPQWDPTTTNATDGARNWSYTGNAAQNNDIYNVGHPGSGDATRGYLKVQTDGVTDGDFQYAVSSWYIADPGSTWTASAWFWPENNDLHGSQEGAIKIEINDAYGFPLTNIYKSTVNASSPNEYQLGSVSIVVPEEGAFIRVQIGLGSPGTAAGVPGHVIIDDASLSTPNQFLANPGWDPSVPGGDDSGRNWSFTYISDQDRSYGIRDLWNAGRNGVTDGALGFFKCEMDGTIAGDFQSATSPWFAAAPDSTWVASGYAINESGVSLSGTQEGIIVLQYADASENVLESVTNTVVTYLDGNTYKYGTVSTNAPADTVFVRMQVGLYQPTANGAGHVLFDDASLTTTNQLLANPGWDPTRAGDLPSDRDNTRNWTPTSANAQMLNDVFGAGRLGRTDGSRGFLKAIVDGTTAPDFQGTTSDWVPVAAGSSYRASVFAQPEGSDIHGSQEAVLVLQFADASSNVLASATNVVADSSSTDAYHYGSVTLLAPANTAFARVQAGFLSPTFDGSGHALFDDASLMMVPTVPVLSIAPGSGGSLTVSWTGGGTLYQNTNLVSGTWVEVSGNPAGSYSFTPLEEEPQLFFQVR